MLVISLAIKDISNSFNSSVKLIYSSALNVSLLLNRLYNSLERSCNANISLSSVNIACSFVTAGIYNQFRFILIEQNTVFVT